MSIAKPNIRANCGNCDTVPHDDAVKPLRVLDLFSGIGGFSLGLERTGGFETKAFCEIDPFCRKVLAKHWPNVPCFEDVTKLRGEDVGPVDVICGGFPCQDISVAGKAAGMDGERSGLWREYARLIGELQPRYVLVENVAALLGRGLGDVLGDLAALGYDAEWHCIPAAAVNAPHIRDRAWIVAHSPSANARRDGQQPEGQEPSNRQPTQLLSDASGGCRDAFSGPDCVADANSLAPIGASIARQERHSWPPEPSVGRVAHGIPNRVDRVRALGNAVVPQIPEAIGRAILSSQASTTEAA